MDTWEVVPGLWHWAAPHPEWEPDAEPDSVGDWPELVGCALAEIGDDVVMVDPLIVDDDGWAWLDARVGGRPVHVLLANPAHERSRAEVLARYGGDEDPPPGARVVAAGAETFVYLEPYRTLVAGDRIIGGREEGTLRRCPPSWTGLPDAELRELLQPLLELDVERVLVSHGESLFAGAGPALAAAIRAPAEHAG
jgi:hypothetical protein